MIGYCLQCGKVDNTYQFNKLYGICHRCLLWNKHICDKKYSK